MVARRVRGSSILRVRGGSSYLQLITPANVKYSPRTRR